MVNKMFTFVEWWSKVLAQVHDMGMSWLWWGKDILWQSVEMMVSHFQCIASAVKVFGFFFTELTCTMLYKQERGLLLMSGPWIQLQNRMNGGNWNQRERVHHHACMPTNILLAKLDNFMRNNHCDHYSV